MASKLKTDWKRIGRSGPTVDGRIIEPEALTQAAGTYDPELFKGLIWPDHLRWFNMGGIEEVRAEANSEGGVDLFAILSPNDYYLSINKQGQRLFTSMELQPNFRDSGKYYLTGMAATDNPASAATSEMRFSQVKEKDTLLGQFTENTIHDFNEHKDDDQPPSWFNRLFSKLNQSDEGDMSKEALENLQTQMTALAEQFSQAFPKKPEAAADGKSEGLTPEKFAALEQQVSALTAEVAKFTQGDKKDDKSDEAETISAEKFNKLQSDFDELNQQFKAALKEQGGTDAGDHISDKEDLREYI